MKGLPSRRPTSRRAAITALGFGLVLVAALTAAQAQPASAAGSATKSGPGKPRLSVTITGKPATSTTSTTASISFTTTNATSVACSLDSGTFVSCVSPEQYSGLRVGSHKVVVRASRDRATATASATWGIVATAPAPSPAPLTLSSTIASDATLLGSVMWQATTNQTVKTVDFYIDGALKWREASSPYLFNGDSSGWLDTMTLPNGAHVLKVVATAENGSSAQTTANVEVANVAAPPVPPTTTPPPTTTAPPSTAGGAGRISVMLATSSSTDPYTNNPSPDEQQWMRDHWTRALVYSTYWDSRTQWFPSGWGYLNAYALYRASTIATQHPEWVLKDASGNNLYIPWGCSGGVCPQYAADIGNPSWRQYYISQAQRLAGLGYKGIFVDDVDMDRNTGDGAGAQVAPIDPRTGQEMTDSAWKDYFASFMEALRAALPGIEIVHNSAWFAGGGAHDATNPSIARQVRAADVVNIERGFNDGGLTGGTGTWSVYALMRYIDNVHSDGARVALQSYANNVTAAEYNLAGYFLVNSGHDYVSTSVGTLQGQWWSGYDTNLGEANGPRYLWNGVWRRDFSGGFVLLNEPGATTKTLNLGTSPTTTSGTSVSSVTLGPAQGAVLRT
jgi:putative glycosyl hydrolase-like family 15 (GHL15) protein